MNPRHASRSDRIEHHRLRTGWRLAVIGSCAIGLAAAVALAGTALAQSSGGAYTLERQSLAGGGGRSSGGVFSLEGTIGQHDASNELGGGAFALTGGFHQRAEGAPGDAMFSNGFEGP
jgi:hypothetical protein